MLEPIPFSNISEAADWAELGCLYGPDESFSRAEIETIFEEKDVYQPEITLEGIWSEIDYRHTLIPNYHPIEVIENRLVRIKSWKETLSYSFMLLLCSHHFYPSTYIKGRPWNKVAKLFERLVTVSLKEYFGSSINIGSPRIRRIRSFHRCLDFIYSITFEPPGQRKKLPHYTKDAGVDVFAWSPIDRRSSQIITLVQVSAGKNWEDKLREISVSLWQDYIDFITMPYTAVAIPYTVPTEEWNYISTKCEGIFFDRLRLTSLFSKNKTSYLKNEFSSWIERQIDELHEMLEV